MRKNPLVAPPRRRIAAKTPAAKPVVKPAPRRTPVAGYETGKPLAAPKPKPRAPLAARKMNALSKKPRRI